MENIINEEWRPVVGWDWIYEVSDQGNIRRMIDARRPKRGPKILKPTINKFGYAWVTLQFLEERRKKAAFIHVLVAEAFVGPKPSAKHEVNHKDSSKGNNRYTNLEWVTHKKNQEHAVESGRYLSGDKHPRKTNASAWNNTVWPSERPYIAGENNGQAKLTDAEATEIKILYKGGDLTQGELAKRFNVSKSAVTHLCAGITWKHIIN